MRIGMNLFLWTDHLTDEQTPVLKRLASLGYGSVEVPVFRGDEAHFKAVKARLDGLGLAATAVVAMPGEANPADSDGRTRQAGLDLLRQSIDRAAAMGASILCGPLHSALGKFSGAGPTQAELAWSADVLRQAAIHAQPRGVTLAVEPLNRFECYLMNTIGDTVKYVRQIDHPAAGLMFDTFHAHIEEKNSAQALKLAGSHLVHVHLSESDRGTPGTGQIGWEPVLRQLKASGYKGWMTVESFGRAMPALAAATRVWRDLAPSADNVAADGIGFLRGAWQRV